MEITCPVLKVSFLFISLFLPWIAAGDPFTWTPYPFYFIEGDNITRPGCPVKCGNLTVPFPFGIGENSGCSIDPYFVIECNTSYDPPKAFLSPAQIAIFNVDGLVNGLEVIDIFNSVIRVRSPVARSCYNRTGGLTQDEKISMDLVGTHFSFSTENKLTVVGCDDISLMSSDDPSWSGYVSSCSAICSDLQDLSEGSCSGIGCCQASIPKGLQFIYTEMITLAAHENVLDFNTCGYAFLAELNSYKFNVSDVSDSVTSFINRTAETVSVVIDWAIGDGTCDQERNTSRVVCAENSECVDSGLSLGGYRCYCKMGYEGNPYLSPGCKVVDECKHNPCHPNALCINLIYSFNCSCFPSYIGDGTKDGSGCSLHSHPAKIAISAGLLTAAGLFFIVAVSFWLYKVLKKRRLKQLKQSFFKRNGGLLLQQQIMSSHNSVLEKMRIFTFKELERATDRFNGSRILGRGGQGTVYKGMLSDGRIVAVKKSKQVDQDQLVEFINEVVILSQINHRNVVKVLGCCLETEVPLLVYEFVPNGNLYELIHDDSSGFPFSWDLRLRIAAEISDALSYLHYATSVPIYHRDMKSNNILLDEKYRAKLSDFGISRSVAIDQTHVTTMVKGTFGYLDPEYFQTGQFTEKSDVYSFGVILVELLTGQKAVSTSTSEEERSLVMRFLLAMKEDCLNTILDPRLVEQGVKDEHVAVAGLARRCLNMNGKKRPTVREVTMELQSVRTCENPNVGSMNEDMFCTETEAFLLEDGEGSSWTQFWR